MKTHKIGLIGVHGRGAHAYKAHRPAQGFEIVMGADPFPPPLRKAKLPGFKAFRRPSPMPIWSVTTRNFLPTGRSKLFSL